MGHSFTSFDPKTFHFQSQTRAFPTKCDYQKTVTEASLSTPRPKTTRQSYLF